MKKAERPAVIAEMEAKVSGRSYFATDDASDDIITGKRRSEEDEEGSLLASGKFGPDAERARKAEGEMKEKRF